MWNPQKKKDYFAVGVMKSGTSTPCWRTTLHRGVNSDFCFMTYCSELLAISHWLPILIIAKHLRYNVAGARGVKSYLSVESMKINPDWWIRKAGGNEKRKSLLSMCDKLRGSGKRGFKMIEFK